MKMGNNRDLKCLLCKKLRTWDEMNNHHIVPKRYNGQETKLICIFCHQILHTSESLGFCKLPTSEKQFLKWERINIERSEKLKEHLRSMKKNYPGSEYSP